MTVRMKTICWSCGFANNRQATVRGDDSAPVNGNVSICFQCGRPAIYDSTLVDNVRKPTPAEMDELMDDEDVIKAIWSINMDQARRPKK